MSSGEWRWDKTRPAPARPKKNWRTGDRVRYRDRRRIYDGGDEGDRFSGIIQGVFPKFLLVMTDCGYRTCVNIYDAEKYMEEI